MKLGEALRLRSDYDTTLSNLRYRITSNVVIPEGGEPSEDPRKLIAIYLQKSEELKKLITRINHTNAVATLDGKKTMTEALAEREQLTRNLNTIKSIASAAVIKHDPYDKKEFREVSLVSVSEYQKKSDEIAKRLRLLDYAIQEKNWTGELVE